MLIEIQAYMMQIREELRNPSKLMKMKYISQRTLMFLLSGLQCSIMNVGASLSIVNCKEEVFWNAVYVQI